MLVKAVDNSGRRSACRLEERFGDNQGEDQEVVERLISKLQNVSLARRVGDGQASRSTKSAKEAEVIPSGIGTGVVDEEQVGGRKLVVGHKEGNDEQRGVTNLGQVLTELEVRTDFGESGVDMHKLVRSHGLADKDQTGVSRGGKWKKLKRAEEMMAVRSQMSDAGYHCITLDWIGFGFSDKPYPKFGYNQHFISDKTT